MNDIQPHLGNAKEADGVKRTFNISLFGNFAGRYQERAELKEQPLTKNNWDQLFDIMAPQWQGSAQLPKVEDLRLTLKFGSLKDFDEKGLINQIPFLKAVKDLKQRVDSCNKENSLVPAGLVQSQPELVRLRDMAAAQKATTVVNLLDMVDIGEDEGEEEESLRLPNLKNFFAASTYEGDKRSKVAAELDTVTRYVVDQVLGDSRFAELHGLWRGLKLFVGKLKGNLKVNLVDCMKGELCDATFLLYVKPETHDPLPLDLAIYADFLDNSDDDRHTLLYLGKMAESLSVPMVLNASPQVFRAKSYRMLSHIRDFSGKLSTPAHIKWKKLRDEPGSTWLFLALNPFLVGDADLREELQAYAPASFYIALVMMVHVGINDWPSELLGPLGQIAISPATAVEFTKDQGDDLAFEGFSAISQLEGREVISLLGMTCFGTIKMPASDKLDARNLVEYTLPYRFFAGCCSRALNKHHPDDDLKAALAAYAGLKEGTEIREETDDEGRRLLQFRAPFSILNAFPNLIIAVD